MDWKKIITTVAPWIGTALGTPFGGMAVEAAASALGLPDKTVDAVKNAISGASPEQMLALKQADQTFALQMQKLGYENVEKLEATAAGDRANARDREVKTGDSWTPRILAAVIVLGWLVVQWYVLGHVVPAEMREIVMRSMGTLDMALGLVLGYYFGSSAGSRENQTALRNAAQKG